MNWNKIKQENPRAFAEYHQQGNFKCTIEDFLTIIDYHGNKIMGVTSEDLNEFFDSQGIYVQIRFIEYEGRGGSCWQWKINDSGWSTESFMCRKACEDKGFEIAFNQREKQWDKII